jgi:hypothetical protein
VDAAHFLVALTCKSKLRQPLVLQDALALEIINTVAQGVPQLHLLVRIPASGFRLEDLDIPELGG